MQATETAALFQHHTALTVSFAELARRLEQASRALQDPGKLPTESLFEELAIARREFAVLRANVLARAEACSLAPRSGNGTVSSLMELKALLDQVVQDEVTRGEAEGTLQQALLVLDLVLAISHNDQKNFAPLVECQVMATELRSAITAVSWPALHPAVESLVTRDHPLTDLLTLVAGQEDLDDERWDQLQETVTHVFGKSLAVAVARGKLRLETDLTLLTPAETVLIEEDPAECVVEAHSVPTALAAECVAEAPLPPTISSVPIADEEELEVLAVEAVSDATGEDSVQEWDLVEEDALSLAKLLELEPAGVPLEKQPLYHFGLDDTAQAVAISILEKVGDDRATALRDLVWRLIFEDKVDLAFHMACCLEAQYPSLQPHLPSWLLRAVTLSRYVRRADGEIARLLREDFAQFNGACFVAGEEEWNTGVKFLLAAAALQPALLAPETGASTLLSALHLPEGAGGVSRYCQRIAEYGDARQPLDPSSLKKGKELVAWQTDMDFLKQAVEAWHIRAPHVAMVYPPAAKVWAKWNEPGGLLATLVLPARQNDLSKLAVAKRTVEQWLDDAHVRREVERTDRETLGRRLGIDINGRAFDQIRMQVREAIGLLRRWVELQETRSKGNGQKQAEDLRQEVWDRHDAVVEGLSVFKRRNPSLLIASGINCCRRVLENIHTLFDPKATFPTEEPLPRPLLYAELLRIASLPLNEQWELDITDRTPIVDGILDLVANKLLPQTAA